MKVSCVWVLLTLLLPFVSGEEEGAWNTQGQVYQGFLWVEDHLERLPVKVDGFYHTLGDYQQEVHQPGDFRGVIESHPFITGRSLTFAVGGAFQNPSIQLGIRDTTTGETLTFKPLGRVEGIEIRKWHLPASWQMREVVLFAIDDNPAQGQWIGVGPVLERSPAVMHRKNFFQMLYLLANLILPLIAFLAIGNLGCALVERYLNLDQAHLIPLFFAFPMLLGYGLFYLAFWSVWLCIILTLVFVLLALLLPAVGVVRPSLRMWREYSYFTPVFLMVLAGVVLASSVLHIGWSGHNSVRLAQERLLYEVLPLDNYLPLLTIDRLYSSDGLKPFILEWRSTDRPPLQAAASLLVKPLFLDAVEGYQVFSSFLQLLSILGIAYFLRSIGICRRPALMMCGAMLLSGTVLLNAVFVWAKFVPVFFLFLLAGMLWEKRSFEKRFEFWLVAGLCCCCVMLIHPGSVFAILALLGVYTIRHLRIHWCQVAAAGLLFVFFMLPWQLYQKHYDPPGNMLQKRFLANHPHFDDVTLGEALRNNYGELTFEQWLSGRIENIKVTIGDFPRALSAETLNQFGKEFLIFRELVFVYLGVSLLPFLLLWLAVLRMGHLPSDLKWRVRDMIVAIVAGLLVWIIVILPEGRTIVSHGSYFFPVLIMVLGMVLIAHYPKILAIFCLLNALCFTVVWVLPRFLPIEIQPSVIYDVHFVNHGSLAAAIGAVACTLLIPVFFDKKESADAGLR